MTKWHTVIELKCIEAAIFYRNAWKAAIFSSLEVEEKWLDWQACQKVKNEQEEKYARRRKGSFLTLLVREAEKQTQPLGESQHDVMSQ